MRDRAWRRWKSDVVILKRIKNHISRAHWYLNRDTNGTIIQNPTWCDFIGQQHIYILKSQTTLPFVRHTKTKWGKKGKSSHYWSSDYHTRPKDKVRFLKELKEYEY